MKIPPDHQLRCTEYVLTGMDDWEWTHEERDAHGNLVARYTTVLSLSFGSSSAAYFSPGPDGIVERTVELTGLGMEMWEAMAAKGGS